MTTAYLIHFKLEKNLEYPVLSKNIYIVKSRANKSTRYIHTGWLLLSKHVTYRWHHADSSTQRHAGLVPYEKSFRSSFDLRLGWYSYSTDFTEWWRKQLCALWMLPWLTLVRFTFYTSFNVNINVLHSHINLFAMVTAQWSPTICTRRTPPLSLWILLQTWSEVYEIHLSRDYLLGHRIHAQGARVSGFDTPALQHNKHHLCSWCQVKITQLSQSNVIYMCKLPNQCSSGLL